MTGSAAFESQLDRSAMFERALAVDGPITAATEEMIHRTSIDVAPWQIVEGVDDYYRNFTVGTLLYDALRDGLDRVTEDRPR